jgi:hypothetical protein
MAITDDERLRTLLGESIPDGGTAADTLFTDEQITDLLARYGSPNDSLAEGWAIKAAALADLVDTTEGSSVRKMSQAHDAALKQVEIFTDAGGVGGRTKIGRIVRSQRP